MTAHQFALRKLGADGLRICDIDLGCKDLGCKDLGCKDLGCKDFGCKRISDVYGIAATGTVYARAGMGMHDSKKATVRA
jgi:hypothetical protein